MRVEPGTIVEYDRQRVVRIRCRASVPWKMLADRQYSLILEAFDERGPELRDDRRVSAECSIANDGVGCIVQDVDIGCEIGVDADCREFAAHDGAALAGGRLGNLQRLHLAEVPLRTENRHSVLDRLDAAALVVDGNQQWR